MRKQLLSVVSLIVLASSIVTIGLITSAAAGTSPTVQIDAIIEGTPDGPLGVELECTDFAATAYPVTETGPVVTETPYSDNDQTCTVTATEAASAVVSYECATDDETVLVCSDDNELTNPSGGVVTGTITVTFAFAPPSTPEPAPAVVIGPTFTG